MAKRFRFPSIDGPAPGELDNLAHTRWQPGDPDPYTGEPTDPRTGEPIPDTVSVIGLDCEDCGSEGNAVAVHIGNDRGAPLCVPCRIARSEERVRVSREIAGLPVAEPEPVPVSWAAVRAAALDCSLADWTDPFDDD